MANDSCGLFLLLQARYTVARFLELKVPETYGQVHEWAFQWSTQCDAAHWWPSQHHHLLYLVQRNNLIKAPQVDLSASRLQEFRKIGIPRIFFLYSSN